MKSDDFNLICDLYLQHGKIFKNFQPATIKSYRSTFSFFAKASNVETLSDLSPEIIEKFLLDGRTKRNWSVVTFRSYLKHLRALCNWCVKKKYLPHNYTDDIDKPPLEKRLPKYLMPDVCEQLLETAYHLPYTYKLEGIRNRAIIGIMIFAGLRLSEISNLKRLDVDLENGVIFVRQGKWNKDRQVPISSRLLYFLLEYVERRSKKTKQISFFTCVNQDTPLSPRAIQVMCRKLKERSGIDFSPQVLRHTFATHTYRGSRDIYAVSGLLGHSSIKTTQVYAHLSLDDKRESVERHLMNNME